MWTFPQLSPENVLFLSGAGISVDGPTGGPVGNELAKWTLDYAFLPETMNEVQNAYRKLGMGADRFPRLEAILEIVTSVHGINVLKKLLLGLESAEPNALHHFFGQHICLGGSHITANFDALIERSAPGINLLHFHGALTSDGSGYEKLGARLSRIEQGFDPDTRFRLLKVLLNSDVQTLIVVGYSGSDYFDMDPFMESVAQQLKGSLDRVLWIEHDPQASPGSITSNTHLVCDNPRILHSLAKVGIECIRISGLTASILNVLATQWDLPNIDTRERVRPKGPTPFIKGTELLRAEATRRLYLHMGMYRSNENLLDAYPRLRANVHDSDAAEVAWQKGDYDLALQHWRNQYSGSDLVSRGHYQERVAACLWAQGAYLRSYKNAREAVKLARQSGDADLLALSIEMESRILIHMARTFDLRWFSSKARRRSLADEIERILVDQRLGFHVGNRIRDVGLLLLENLGSRRGSQWFRRSVSMEIPSLPALSQKNELTEAFEQYESLSAVMDYRRGQMRRTASAGHTVLPSAVHEYRKAAEYLGKTAAITTLFTVPGIASHYGWREVLSLLPKVSATPWHRVRLLGKYIRMRRAAP